MKLKYRSRRGVYYLRFRAKKIRTGSCLECARRIVPGFRRCQVHILKGRKQNLVCPHCKKPLSPELKTVRHIKVHPICQIERRRLMQRLNWARSSRTSGYIKAHRQAVNRWQTKQKSLGLCIVCHRKVQGEFRRCRLHAQ